MKMPLYKPLTAEPVWPSVMAAKSVTKNVRAGSAPLIHRKVLPNPRRMIPVLYTAKTLVASPCPSKVNTPSEKASELVPQNTPGANVCVSNVTEPVDTSQFCDTERMVASTADEQAADGLVRVNAAFAGSNSVAPMRPLDTVAEP
jgi:hypothetical protein